MPYDFPASPTPDQEFTPSGGPTYIWKSPRWFVKGGTMGGDGGSGVVDWTEITGKPSTFPPATPIAQASITNLTTDLATKEPLITTGTTAQYRRGDKSWQTLDKTAAGLANVDNTTDANKPVSTAQQTALNLKANIASPTFTGKVTTAASAGGGAGLILPPGSAPSSPANGDIWTTTTGVFARINGVTQTLAPLDSPTFTGTPAAPTAAPGVNTTQLATTAFVTAAVAAAGGGAVAWASITGKPSTFPPTVPIAQIDITNLITDLAAKAALSGATFTGKLISTPATAANAGFNIPVGSIPSLTQVDGDLWMRPTGLFVRVNGVNVGPLISATTPTFIGKATTAASASGSAGFNLPHGTAPTAPVDGDVWTTTTGVFARINGATVGPIGTWSGLTGKPATFPPDAHTHPEIVGTASASMNTLGEIETYIYDIIETSLAEKVEEPPEDNVLYGRQDFEWKAAVEEAESDGTVYGRQNNTWVAISSGGAATEVADTPPLSPTQGQLWFDSSTANLYLYYDDGTSAAWIQVNATGAA